MTLQTTVFKLASEQGWSDRELARRMSVSPATISRVKNGEYGISTDFVVGARRAFPDKSLDDLFSVNGRSADDSAAT